MSENEGRRPAVVRTNDSGPIPPKEIDWAEVYAAQQAGEDAPPPGGFLNNQLAKIGCGCLLPALFMLGTCSAATFPYGYGMGDPATLLGQVTGGFIGGMLFVWAPLFLFWLRDQSKWIIGGSFAFFAAIFVMIGLVAVGRSQDAMEEDLAALSQIQYDVDGNPILTPGMASKGPMTKLMFEVAAEQAGIRKDFEAEVAQLGVVDMMQANRVTRQPSLVQNCDRIPEFRARIEAYRARNIKLINSMPERIDAMIVSFSAKEDIRRGAMNRMGANLETINAEWDLQIKAIAPVHRTCQVLSQRNWTAQGEIYMFNSRADLNNFDSAMREIDLINAEIKTLTNRRMQGVRADQERLKQQISR